MWIDDGSGYIIYGLIHGLHIIYVIYHSQDTFAECSKAAVLFLCLLAAQTTWSQRLPCEVGFVQEMPEQQSAECMECWFSLHSMW